MQHVPYVNLMPETFDTPLHYTEAELQLLQDTSLYHNTMQRLERTAENAERGWAWLHSACRDAHDPIFAHVLSPIDKHRWLSLWRWADDVYGSRSFPAHLAGWEGMQGQEPVLIPGLDSFNHGRGVPVTWEKNDGITLLLRSSIPANAQVLNNYGAKSNEELLAAYGFVQADGPDDVLVLALRAQEKAQSAMFYWKRSDDSPPQALLDALRRQMGFAPNEAQATCDANIASLLQEAQVVEALERFLQQRSKAFQHSHAEAEDAVPWSKDGDSVRERVLSSILEYRRGQARLLDQALDWTEAKLDAILAALDKKGYTIGG
ncbi:hypothetical protein MVES1_001151 [Malassezia vespertilionis]|uniref:SET domain-containing protein n=1 Tax=Malassezia vespertilionis TaxID=2020962 RepID=A0A2N1JDW4_9BASI|nr:uncharacterized protein MVES1_001151 [Malassezia vespertilionis]PKI84747.1 hypothetical protein MVES_001086 [Malassezia vespertilionis]WFD05817.1 hypothetical protein MVES1_001151 [Malassezia vespertilionis]